VQAYAFAARLFHARNNHLELFAIRCDNPKVFSTARPAGRPGLFRVRAYSGADESETARFEFMPGTAVRRVNRTGKRTALGGKRRGDEVELKLRPFEIGTLEVERRS
jgi:hypothetical protein